MILAWIRLASAGACLVLGLLVMMAAVYGVNRFKRALNRMHVAALGDTLGILFVMAGLMILRGFSMDTLKLFLVIAFFWLASPVSGHMISRLEAMTNEDLGELTIIRRDKENRETAPAADEKVKASAEKASEGRSNR